MSSLKDQNAVLKNAGLKVRHRKMQRGGETFWQQMSPSTNNHR